MSNNKMSKIADNKYICNNQFEMSNSVVLDGDKVIKNEDVFDCLTDAQHKDAKVVCTNLDGSDREYDYEVAFIKCLNAAAQKKVKEIVNELLKKYARLIYEVDKYVVIVVRIDRRVKYAVWTQINKAFTIFVMDNLRKVSNKTDKNNHKMLDMQRVYPPALKKLQDDDAKMNFDKLEHVQNDKFIKENGKCYVIKTDTMMTYLKQVKSVEMPSKQWQELLVGKSKTKKVNGELVETFTWDKTSQYNANLVTQNMLAGLFKYNSLTQSVEAMRTVDLETRKILIKQGQISSNTVTNLKMWLEFAPDQQLKINSKQALEVINAAAQRNQYSPFMDYLNSLPRWDGKKRLEQLFIKSLGADNTKMNRWLPLLVTIGLIYRAKHPGSDVDAVIDLTGDQRAGKTKMIKKLVSSYGAADEERNDPNWNRPDMGWYLDGFESFSKRDDMMSFIGKLYLNDDELAASHRTHPELIKAFATENSLTFRKPYDIEHTVYHRCNLLWRTSNDLQLYRSKIGQQKFFPIVVHKDRIKWNVAGKNPTWTVDFVDQVWAEAVHLYVANGEKWANDVILMTDDAEIKRENEVAHAQLQFVDDLTMSLVGYIADKFAQIPDGETLYLASKQIKDDLDFKSDMSDTKISRKVANIMTNDLGFKRHSVTYQGSRALAGYASTPKSRDAIALSCRAYHINVDSADAFVSSDEGELNNEIETSLA